MIIFKKAVTVCLAVAAMLCLFTGCSAHNCGVVDNDTPIVYEEVEGKEIVYNGKTYDIYTFALLANRGTDADAPKDFCYEVFVEHFGFRPLRKTRKATNTYYYTVYPFENNQLLYFFWNKTGAHYALDGMTLADFRSDSAVKECVLDKDLPSVILGDRKPADCYLSYYSQAEVDRKNSLAWESYRSYIGMTGLGEIGGTDPKGNASVSQIRCLQTVAFDVTILDSACHGAYIYDIYIYGDGTGSLCFYHYADKFESGKALFECLQKETIALSGEEISALQGLMDTWDFANYPTWNPEELSGFDGETTWIYAHGDGGDHLISMWSASERYPHYQIRAAIENMVRSHITVNEGRIYNEE